MPSATSGRIVKTSRGSKKTPHQKNHRWESFSQKISKLHSLDPLRKVRRHDLEAEDLSATTSYLRNGLDKWAELNISRPYMAFKREVNPLTESLAQILYHEDRIMDLLAESIARHEKEALEPLLDLLTAFAHDLGVRFEKHYPRALALIIDLASKVHDVEVIEWTFAALAFLFKYLSRLLVPDLRPTYDVVAPLMGKARNPGHIARFAAEAMSFLVKKAAAPSHKDKALPLFVEHVRKDLQSMVGHKQFDLYSQGIMTMFAEAIKGVGEGVHSTGSETLAAILRQVPEEELRLEGQMVWTQVCSGVLTSVIHHTNVDTFKLLETRVVEEATSATQTSALFIQVLGVMAGVRKGTRIHDWASFTKALSQILASFSSQKEQVQAIDPSRVWQRIIVNTAIVWDRAPIDALIPVLSSFNATIAKEPLMNWYILFCSYLADLNPEKFRSLFLKDFQKFIVAHWSQDANEDILCVILPRMVQAGGLPAPGGKETFQLPQSWQDQIVSKFVRLEDTPFPESWGFGKDPETWRDKCLPKYSARLRILQSTTVHPSTNARIAEVLLKKLKLALRPSSSLPTDEANFIVSDGFRAYLRMSAAAGSIDLTLAPLLRAAAPRFCRSPAFLEALLEYEKEVAAKGKSPDSASNDSPGEEEDPLIKCLTENLSTPSHELRLASLRILEVLDFTPDSNAALETMIQIEELPLNLQSVRTIAVHLRKLGQIYSHISQDSWLIRAVPSFLFGMTTVPLAPVWDDAVEAMKKVAEVKAGEEALADIAFEWLDVPSPQWSGPYKPPAEDSHKALTNFECLNLMSLHETASATGNVLSNPAQEMLGTFEEGQRIVDSCPTQARSKALKAFNALPFVAEKRSRRLVPYLFSFADVAQVAPEEEDEESSDDSAEGGWSLPDRKALIGVFSQFNNPRVLYQSQRVYQCMLKLLANGDAEVQKLALKSILTWKSDAVKPYQEHLEYLLDEARFKNELTVLFQGDDQIKPEHRKEAIPVLLHLLYGRAIAKKGVASGRHGLHATRLAIIRQLNVQDMGSFLDIAVGELKGIRVLDGQALRESLFKHEALPPRKQVGLLNMVEAVINELGTSISMYMETLVNAVLYCLIYACRHLGGRSDEADAEETEIRDASLYRVVRTTGLKCLCKLIQNGEEFDWTPYREILVKEIVSPRIEKLPVETTQGVSGIWKLLGTWAGLAKTALFLAVDSRILPKILETLGIEKARDEVKIFALDILQSLVKLAQPSEESKGVEQIKTTLLDPHIDLILRSISSLLRDQPEIGRELLATAVDTVVALAPIVEKSSSVPEMVEIVTFLLNQPLRKVNPKVKGSILLILKQFIVLEDVQSNAQLKRNVYATLSSLFGFFKDKQNRQTLAEVLEEFASREPWAQEVADICRDLNAYVAERLDEPDYNTRLAAFTTITKDRETPFTIDQWMPLVHNLLYYIQQDEEFGVLASNSSDGLCKFVSAAESAWESDQQAAFTDVLSDVILPAIYAGARNPSETVRREILRLFGFLVSHLPQWTPVSDLTPLIPESDESEDAFFFHILSPAVSRQLQALRLLEDANNKSELRSKHISQFFIPLFEHFIFDRPEGGDDHGLSAQATNTIAALTASLEWQQYRAILRRFVSYVESKPDWSKRVIRLLEKEVDALRAAVTPATQDVMDVDGEVAAPSQRRLAKTLPDQEKLGAEIVNGFLPTLLKYIHEKDETTVSARVPVGVIIAKLLTLLPSNLLHEKLPGVLTDIAHILRSKSWESREMARDTLAKVAGILGPDKFEFILKELRGALLRGHQLHVLSYTLHSILLATIPAFPQGALDYCLPSIVAVIMDDIFGVVGQEKDAEGYVSQMKEVKSSKSQDSMELIARTASITRLGDLTMPLQSLLMEKIDLRTVRKIDELLTRITKGLLENPAAASQDVLVFCYEVVQEVYKSQKPEEQPKIDPRLKRYLVQRAARKSDGAVTAKHTYKLIRFAIEVLRAVLKKHDHLRTASNLAGFLPMLGDAVLSVEEEVKVAAFKLLTVITKVPFKNNDLSSLYKVAHKEAIKTISLSPTTTTELAQSALKLISVILRDRREIPMRDAALDMLLSKLKDDLTEPMYRHISFNFLRAVLDRKLEAASVYDTLDHVGTIMITNDDKDTRDLARGAFFQFLREYPQKRNRWEKQLKFIVANLSYDREGGRLSVMEVIHLLLKKSADEFAQEVAATCFVPLMLTLANDDSEKCRLAAGELVKECFRVADRERLAKFLALMRPWIGKDVKTDVLKLGLRAFGLYFDGREPSANDNKDVGLVLAKVLEVLDSEEALEADWELANIALGTLQILVQRHPQRVLAADSTQLWTEVQACLAHSNDTVKLTAIKLLSMYLADFARNAAKGQTLPMAGSHGLELDSDDVSDLTRLALGILSAPEVDEGLAQEASQVVLFLGGFLESGKKMENGQEEEEGDEAEEDEANGAKESGRRRADTKYLFWKLASIIRKERQPKAEVLVSKLAAMDLLETFVSKTAVETVLASAKTILRPLRNLTDPSIKAPFSLNDIFKERYEALKAKAQLIMELLQRRLGSAEYSRALVAVGELVREKRQQRSTKRKIEALTAPDKYGREKRKKLEKKKEKRKARGREQREQRRIFQS